MVSMTDKAFKAAGEANERKMTMAKVEKAWRDAMNENRVVHYSERLGLPLYKVFKTAKEAQAFIQTSPNARLIKP